MLSIAHRGASGYELENTLKAFRKAIELKADVIECDAHLTKDDEVVIIHDETVNRTTNGRGKVKNLTLEEIKKLKTKNNERIPTLEEVIEVVKGRCKLNIEVKDDLAINEVLKIIQRTKSEKKVMISSNNPEVLAKVNLDKALIFHTMSSNLTQIIFESIAFILLPITKKIIFRRAKKGETKTINLTKTLATKGMVDYLHQNKIKVNVWTVNSKKRIKKLNEINVDGIISNYPDLVK